MKYAFAGDRQLSVNILAFLIDKGEQPAALLVRDRAQASHSQALIKLVENLDIPVYEGKAFLQESNIDKLKQLQLDYIIGIHFPYIIPRRVLDIPSHGFLNLHPAYLPYNKGWHTPSWAIWEGTPYGATLHYMSEALDEGDIIHQKQLDVKITDTANTLYQRCLALEEQVFKEAFDDLVALQLPRKKQVEAGSSHQKKDLKAIQELTLNKEERLLIDRLRALTTNDVKEAAYFIENGQKISIQVSLHTQKLT